VPTGDRFVLGKALRETAESVDSQGRATGSAKADLCRSTLLCPLIASDQQFVKAKGERLLPASTNEYFDPERPLAMRRINDRFQKCRSHSESIVGQRVLARS
jgi:hypothetical protein